MEGIRINRRGYPNKLKYKDFVEKYQSLVPSVQINPQEPKNATEIILKELNIPESGYKLGLSKIFFRSGQLDNIEVFFHSYYLL